MEGSGVKILVVEDDPDIREIMLLILGMEGFSVTGIDNGHDVPIAIQQLNPDVILLDVLLGDMDGREICRSLKKAPETMNIPIMIVSATHGYSGDSTCGANDYLSKPFDIDDLIDRVKRLAA